MCQKCYFHDIKTIKQTPSISINRFNNWNIPYNDNCQTCDTSKLLSKSIISIINKKHIGVYSTSQNLWNRSVSEHIKPAYSTQIHPLLQSWWTLVHTLLWICGYLADRDVKIFPQIDI